MAKAKRPQIEPARFTGQLAGINTILNAIREQMQIDQGDRGDPLDRAVKIRDLTEAGVAEFLLSKRGKGQYATVVAPAGNQLVTAAPPNPENLQANPTTATIYLTWDAPNYPYHAYTEVWRNTEDNLSTAIDLGARPAYRYYADPVDSGRTYYYWIRFVTHAGKKSDYNAVDGVSATTNLDPSVVLETLNDKITSSQLVKGLRDEIELISELEGGLAQEVEARIFADTKEKQERIESIQQEAEQTANSILLESQERIKSFQALQSIESLVGNDARELKALARISNEEVSRIQQYQELSASYQTLKSTSNAQIIRLDEAIASESEARASSIVSLTAKFENDLGIARDAAVEEAINVITTNDDVIAQVITKISAADTANWATTTYVTDNVVTPLNALATRTDTLESQYQSLGSTYLSQSSFTDWQQSYSTDKTATAERLNSLETSLTNPSTGLSSKASVSQLTQAKNDIYNSAVSQFGSIEAKFQNQQSDINARATQTELNEVAAGLDGVSVNRLSQAITTLKQSDFESQTQYIKNIEQSSKADRSQMTRYERMESEYKTGLSATKASITQLAETVSTESTARANAITQLTTAINGQTATLEQQASSIDGLRANWAVKFQIDDDGVKRVSGFGLSADGESTGAHFDVDQFSISKPGAEALDFAVADVLQPNGTTKRMVVMDAASIVNLVVKNAMIESISADKITAGLLGAQFIDTENLTVKDAKSSNYLYQTSGWRLTKDGFFEINSSTDDGRFQQDSTGIRVYDKNGVIRLKIGEF